MDSIFRSPLQVEAEVENWISKYDVDMTERHAEAAGLQERCGDEQAQLRVLEERLAVLEAEYNVIMEEHRLEVCCRPVFGCVG